MEQTPKLNCNEIRLNWGAAIDSATCTETDMFFEAHVKECELCRRWLKNLERDFESKYRQDPLLVIIFRRPEDTDD